MEKTLHNNFSEHEIRIIDEITITTAIVLSDYLKANKRPTTTIMKAYSKLTSSEKNVSRVFMTLLIPNMNQEKGMYPEEIHKNLTEISKFLIKGSEDIFLNRPSTRSKLLKEFENRDIFYSIRGKNKIKLESPKSVEKKPKIRKDKREGYPIVYKLTSTVQEYKRILLNPQCVHAINNRLRKYGILKKAYDLISRQAFYFLKTGDEKKYDFLQIFKVMFPNMNTNAIPDPKTFKEQIDATEGKELEKIRKELVQHILENPSSCVLLTFSLSKLVNS
jgi:hypothetical protein